jgi:hypothetical protein
MGGKKPVMLEIMETFLIQLPLEMDGINKGIESHDYAAIKKHAHTMRSTVSIMGISTLEADLREMESMGSLEGHLERMKQIQKIINTTCTKAIHEIEHEKLSY